MTVTMKGQPPLALEIVDTEKKKFEVLAVKDDVVTKAKITYDKRSKVEKSGKKEKAKASAVEGKTYTLTAGDPVTVEPAGEADDVRKEEKRFGKADKLRLAIAGKEYTKGKSVELKPDDVRDMFGDSGDVEITKFVIEYVGMVGKNAKFTMVAAMKSKKPDQKMAMDLKGTVVVDVASAEPLEMDVTGTMKSDDGQMKIDGSMTMSGRRSK
jgi:hypothetical protein